MWKAKEIIHINFNAVWFASCTCLPYKLNFPYLGENENERKIVITKNNYLNSVGNYRHFDREHMGWRIWIFCSFCSLNLSCFCWVYVLDASPTFKDKGFHRAQSLNTCLLLHLVPNKKHWYDPTQKKDHLNACQSPQGPSYGMVTTHFKHAWYIPYKQVECDWTTD